MPKITFQLENKTIEAKAGTELLDAARQAQIEIAAPCGGKGTCAGCIIRVVSGAVESESSGNLSAAALSQGYVLACKSKLKDEDIILEIPEQLGKEGGQFIDETDDTCSIPTEFLPQENQHQPLAVNITIDVPAPQLEDGLSDIDRLTRAIKQHLEKKEVHFPLPIIRQTAQALRPENQDETQTPQANKERDNSTVTLSLVETPQAYHVVAIRTGKSENYRNFGIAVDIGTTTVAVQLVELPTGKVLATQTAYNEQVDCGLDVISRINYARKPQRLQELRERVLHTINKLIHQLCSGNQVEPSEILNAAIAGNTTMIHLLLGLPPEYIRLEPYTPTLLKSPFFTAEEIGLHINPISLVHISPAVGSYVGGDITAGLLCTPIAQGTQDVYLFIDIGTNGELVIGNDDFLMTCACSAGPAFEGGGIDCGMRAALGAIDHVDIDPQNGTPTYRTIGQVKPKGICGTGMISLLANLFLSGWLDAAGKLNRDKSCPAIEVSGRQARYIIVPTNETGNGKAITISEIDIDNIIRAKAAIYSASALMLEQVGLSFDDLANIYIGGGFGRFLDIEQAITIGLIPDIPREKYKYIGNSSLMGAYMALVSLEFRQKQLALARRTTYIELSSDPAYMDQYTGALFLPHTDSSRFPTISGQ